MLVCAIAACSGGQVAPSATTASAGTAAVQPSGVTPSAPLDQAVKPQPPKSQPAGAVLAAKPQGGPKYWEALLVAGDDSLPVFDNGVTRMRGLLTETNVVAMRTMSSNFAEARPEDIATAAQIDQALAAMPQSPDTGCFIYMTSHGGLNGMLLTDDLDSERVLTPGMLGRILDARCGTRPTVAIVSACYSGIFLDRGMVGPNRIILTAARSDRPSFGCGEGNEYTYYDSCIIESWQKVHSFRQLYDRALRCVRDKEAALKVKPSEPQAYFGAAIGDVPLPR
jgi:hypothetical protein